MQKIIILGGGVFSKYNFETRKIKNIVTLAFINIFVCITFFIFLNVLYVVLVLVIKHVLYFVSYCLDSKIEF